MSLDLSAFACNQIQVSFSVVSEGGQSEFSPDQSLCLDGGKMSPTFFSLSSYLSVHILVSLLLVCVAVSLCLCCNDGQELTQFNDPCAVLRNTTSTYSKS